MRPVLGNDQNKLHGLLSDPTSMILYLCVIVIDQIKYCLNPIESNLQHTNLYQSFPYQRIFLCLVSIPGNAVGTLCHLVLE